jgi:transposase
MFNLGIDVSKIKLDCALLLDTISLKIKHKVVENSPEGYQILQQWVSSHIPKGEAWQVVMEATGVYHENLAYALHHANIPVAIINPAQLRMFAHGLAVKSKNDRLDAVVIARFGAERHPKLWLPPSQEVRGLTQLLGRSEAITKELQREKNRVEKASVTDTHSLVNASLAKSILFLKQQLKDIQQAVDEMIEADNAMKQDKALLETIPAVGDKTSTYMTMLFHQHHFEDAPQVTAFLGLIPVEHTSGSSVYKRPHLAKSGHPRLRCILYMAALVAMTHNLQLRTFYQRLLAKGKAKKAALGAVMRKLVHICYGVFKHQKPYQTNIT